MKMKGCIPAEPLQPEPQCGGRIQALTSEGLESKVQLGTLISSFVTSLTLFHHLSHAKPKAKHTPLKVTSEN